MPTPDKSILLEEEISRVERVVAQLCHEIKQLRTENEKLKGELSSTQGKAVQLEQKLELAKVKITALLASIPEYIND
jgi:predicted  nucleic acid-binding Zn-ribbon protein